MSVIITMPWPKVQREVSNTGHKTSFGNSNRPQRGTTSDEAGAVPHDGDWLCTWRLRTHNRSKSFEKVRPMLAVLLSCDRKSREDVVRLEESVRSRQLKSQR
jgi:hypothetical protein